MAGQCTGDARARARQAAGASGRFDGAGAAVWVNLSGDTVALDLELDPDGVPHVLTVDALISYLP